MEDSAVLLHESVICGHHIYESVWSLILGETVSVDCEHGNLHDRHAVCLLKGGSIVGHVPRELAKYFFLDMVEQLLAKLQEAESMERA